MLSKKNIIQKTLQVGGSTLISRFFGIIRELLMVRYLGASALSDAFLTAFKIPNSLRKIFAEGALSSAFIPTIVQAMRSKGPHAVSALMTLGVLIFEGIVLLLCALTMAYAPSVLWFIAPGFSESQIQNAVPYLHILMPFIFFLSSSALIAGALQAVGHFFIPAFAPVLINLIFIIGLLICLYAHLPVTALCWFILFAGFVQLLIHVIVYLKLQFHFAIPNKHELKTFGNVLIKFALCLPSVSMMEIALFIDTSFASYLAPGSMSLLYYANRFMGIPLGIFPVALSTILLPHFSRISAYAPKRLSFYLFESTKLIIWITLPVTLFMSFFAHDLFRILFLSKQFTQSQAYEASSILIMFLFGLFFFSLNKIILNVFYALHNTWSPALVSAFATLANAFLNYCFINSLQAVGLALATTLSGLIQTVLFWGVLHYYFNFRLYGRQLLLFFAKTIIQLLAVFGLFTAVYYGIRYAIVLACSSSIAYALLHSILFWTWVCPLLIITMIVLWYSRSLFAISLYFLDE